MKIIIYGIVVSLLLMGGLWSLQSYLNKDFVAWEVKCANDGGMTVITKEKTLSDHYECLKDGKIINHVED